MSRKAQNDHPKRFQIVMPDVHISEFHDPDSMKNAPVCTKSGESETFLPKDYESNPVFSYNINSSAKTTWEADAHSLHELWMKKANTSVSHDRYPHAAIKRLMRLNPEVFQVCAEVLAPFSLLADMFVGMLFLGASHNDQSILTEKDVIHKSIAPNPLLTWAIDAIDINVLMNLQPEDDINVIANVLPELIVRNYPLSIKKQLIEAHFKLLEASEEPLGEIPDIVDASGRVITSSDILVTKTPLVESVHSGGIDVPNTSSNLMDNYGDSSFSSEIRHSSANAENRSAREIEDILTETTINAMNRETQDCHMYSLQQMDYVSFYSHIDPWFEDESESDGFGSPLDFTKGIETERPNNRLRPNETAAW